MTDWTIAEVNAGSYEILKGRRLAMEDVMSEQQALSWVFRRMTPGDKVVLREKDGYQIDVTRQLQRRTR